MSFEVTTHFHQQYTTNVQLLLQQRGSKLRRVVTEHGFSGKAAKAVEQISSVTAVKRTSRHADTPLISTPSFADRAIAQSIAAGVPIASAQGEPATRNAIER